MAFVLSVCLVVCASVLCDPYLIPPIALEWRHCVVVLEQDTFVLA